MLQRFSKMRKMNFENVYRIAIPNFCQTVKGNNYEFECPFGDQSMFYAVQVTIPLFQDLEDSWTLELCHKFRGHRFKHLIPRVNVMHDFILTLPSSCEEHGTSEH